MYRCEPGSGGNGGYHAGGGRFTVGAGDQDDAAWKPSGQGTEGRWIQPPGYVAWELPRTRRQSQAAYAASWRREFAGLVPADFPLVGGVLDELAEVAGEQQFELGLSALAAGLAAHL